MALTEPQSVTVNSVAISLPRVGTGINQSTYQSNDGNTKLFASHQYGKRSRRLVRLESAKIAPDPLISAQNIKYNMAVHLVVDAPVTGYTVAEQKQVVDAFIAWLSASSGASITKLLGGES